MPTLEPSVLDQLFHEARTHNVWLDNPVDDELLHTLYDTVKYGPTAANSTPARFVFVKSAAAKEQLVPCMSAGNQEKTRQAPVTVIVAYDTQFHEQLPKLFPHVDARSWYAGDQARINAAALMNSSLQGGYLVIAARALGLDCGPMGGFDADKVNATFFPDGQWKVNFICNLGYGDTSKVHPRNPRLTFEEACRVL
ncbi:MULTISPECIES: malonic semialdehyde reductase [Ralstonia solanacearum species complex]|uniref:Putative NADH dehydrogenase/NAD(P)H nitroreductase RSc1004 n=3 Tax=Ralstonia solanacearum species complex TaxID=3116862 RepID=Y1004_RALN1|nr:MULTISPECIES: malonic semialdehyde reductase [Ralstonia]Q8Y0N9.1 RecName: Full=Putative NADH dehydrogenase/NAD(P)H nitroreductase RSc1004 [Ralstonia pseudosolanacearum GMI1000]ANH33727.1 malonic semialdehyde reductase [Ralstonia solanacearum]APC68053.1 nitroreductase family protein [Ralstonia solanacearum OE1-1]APF87677.1 malonic semialdehyde reductase [Ralstonia solanacearum FJAT-1458]ARS55604.1 malonic semialdehyde reductase [Ralstonia solanacearum FJAT-91]ESS48705.1 hypothetical protein